MCKGTTKDRVSTFQPVCTFMTSFQRLNRVISPYPVILLPAGRTCQLQSTFSWLPWLNWVKSCSTRFHEEVLNEPVAITQTESNWKQKRRDTLHWSESKSVYFPFFIFFQLPSDSFELKHLLATGFQQTCSTGQNSCLLLELQPVPKQLNRQGTSGLTCIMHQFNPFASLVHLFDVVWKNSCGFPSAVVCLGEIWGNPRGSSNTGNHPLEGTADVCNPEHWRLEMDPDGSIICSSWRHVIVGLEARCL